MGHKELQDYIATYYVENGAEMTVKVLCNMISIVAEQTGSFEVENDRNGVEISVEVPK